MKKIVALILTLTLIFTFTACSAGGGNETTTANTQNTSSDTTSAENEQTEGTPKTDKKILTVYFSSANTADADAVSKATPDFDGVASTEYIAQYINKKVGGDIAKITPVKDYPKSYAGTVAKAKTETDKDECPEFQKLSVNPEDYDVIFVGYPMWWYTLPMIMYTFFDTYDLSGKTIIPFNTHAGSGDGGTYEEIKGFEPKATVLDGLAVSGSSANEADSDLDKWLAGLNY